MQPPLVVVLAGLLFWIFGPEVTRKSPDDRYDFIIVGGGTAGSVVASKLSDDFSTKVLLLEAGDTDRKEPRIYIPGYRTSLRNQPVDWNYTTAPQDHTFYRNPDRTIPYYRGHVLGGSSSVNAMAYSRGSPHDFDSWEDHGAEGWNFKSIEQNFLNVENARGEYMPKNIGRHGRVKLSNTYFPGSALTQLMEGIAASFGSTVGNYIENLEGFSYAIVTVYGLMRQNSATSYLRSVLPNSLRQLHILDNAHVTKILIDEKEKAYGVRFVKDGKTISVYSDKEVVVCAGVFGSPQLLMLSGVGPKDELDKFNITVIRDLPGVGSNFDDHIRVSNLIQTNIKLPEPKNEDPEIQYLRSGSGPLIDFEYYYHATKSKYYNTTKSVSNDKRPFPDIFTIFVHTRSTDGTLLLIAIIALGHGKSRGTVRLRSADPFAPPIIDPQYYSHQDDIDVHIDGLRLVEKYETSEAMVAAGARFIPPAACKSLYTREVPRSDEFYKCVIKYMADTFYHGCGTAKIGKRTDKYAVVDSKLRVYGIKNLRVADASVMPHVTSTNTQAPSYMIGDKTAEVIIEDWGLNTGRK